MNVNTDMYLNLFNRRHLNFWPRALNSDTQI